MDELESLGLSKEKPVKYGFFKHIQVFFNKLRMFMIYRNILKMNKETLYKGFNIRVDDVYRLYTVFVVPQETMSLLSMKENKYHMVFQQEMMEQLTSYIKGLGSYLKSIGMNEEWYGITEMTKIDDMNYKIVISFAGFDTVKVANYLLSFVIGTGSIALIWIIKFLVELF